MTEIEVANAIRLLQSELEQLREERMGVEKPTSVRLRIDPYQLVREAVEGAIRYGYHRAHKHTDNPSEEQVIEAIQISVMGALCDVLDFNAE
jgi:hypothetical protein